MHEKLFLQLCLLLLGYLLDKYYIYELDMSMIKVYLSLKNETLYYQISNEKRFKSM